MGKEQLQNEVNLIHDAGIRETVDMLLDKVPEYFWHVAASSTGKYHPDYALGEGGLVRHTRAAVAFAEHLFGMTPVDDHTHDIIVAALILHDSCKHGLEDTSGYTMFDHPIVASRFIASYAPAEFAAEVCPLVESHMGRWNTAKYSSVILPVPETDNQKFVHLCDYLASRKNVEVILK